MERGERKRGERGRGRRKKEKEECSGRGLLERV